MSSVTLPRPAERAAIFSFLLVFLCGVAAGALIINLTKIRHGAPPPSSTVSMFSVNEMKDSLNLTEEQTRQVTSVLDDFSTMYDNLLADGHTRILQILDPEQKKRFAQMFQQHRK
jgi:Spy/CpxP family protein refolding chaperone